jgi:membrane-bound metal-dependent hydrolase YbcI (DUF457 family)
MSLAVTHVILTIIAVDLYRDYFTKSKKYFTLHTILVAGIASLLPDIDILINWTLRLFGYSIEIMQHGGVTHTLLFGLVFLAPALFFCRRKNHKLAAYFFVIAFAVMFHILMDYVLGGGAYEGVMWFWPLSDQAYKIHLLSGIGIHIPMAVDAFILIVWLWHEEVKHKIKDFI